MSMIDIARLLQPISADEPCGEDLSDLTEYYVLENLVAGGEPDSAQVSAEPEWPRVLNAASDLLERGKELRVLIHLLHALVHINGIAGLRDGLDLLAQTLETFWDSLYPLLEEDYDAPAEGRMNLLRELSAGAVGGETISPLVQAIRAAPLSNSRQMGTFCWRDVQIATGELPTPAEEAAPQTALIEGAIRDTAADELADLAQALEQSIALASRIDAFLTEKVGSDNTCQIAKLEQLLTLMLRHLRQAISSGGVDENAPVTPGSTSAAAPPVVKGFSGAIGSQGDVLKALDAICDWYDKNERSSPVPYFLKRAKRLVGQDFMVIVHDVARHAEDSLQELLGVEEEED